MSHYAKHVNRVNAPVEPAIPGSGVSQSQPIAGAGMVPASKGAAWAFPVGVWTQVMRFLIIGSVTGSCYASEKELTEDNIVALDAALREDGLRLVDTLTEISLSGRAPKDNPLIFALAYASVHGNDETRRLAYDVVPQICRTPAKLMSFRENVRVIREKAGRGPSSHGLRRSTAAFYNSLPIDKLAYHAVKYQSRKSGGTKPWTNGDLLKLARPKPVDEAHSAIYAWMIGDAKGKGGDIHPILGAFEELKTLNPGSAADVRRACDLIVDNRLPFEAVPTAFQAKAEIWNALYQVMPVQATLTNLSRLTRLEVLSNYTKSNLDKLSARLNCESLKKARVHPVNVLKALVAYKNGAALRGNTYWSPVRPVCDLLEQAFYDSFGAVSGTGVRRFEWVDVTRSMAMRNHGYVAGIPNFYPRTVAAAQAMTSMRVEPLARMMGFNVDPVEFEVGKDEKLESVIKRMNELPMGATDCSTPMRYALEQGIAVDAFVLYTDHETNFKNSEHPITALERYRREMEIPAKLIVVGCVANKLSIANDDANCLDVVGFDTASPKLIDNFIRGAISREAATDSVVLDDNETDE